MTKLLLVLLLVCVSALPCITQAQPPLPVLSQTTVKFEPLAQSGSPVVDVRLNGTVTAHLLLDTGASTSALSQEIVDRLRLPLQGEVETAVGKFQTVHVPMMQIGTLDLFDDFVVLKTSFLGETRSQHIDGILGQSTLLNLALFLNFGRQEITFSRTGNVPGAVLAQLGFRGDEAAPVRLTFREDRQLFYTDAKVAGKTFALLLDTGSDKTTFPKPLAAALTDKPLYDRDSTVVTGTRKEPIYVVPGITVGKSTGARQAVAVANDDTAFSHLLGVDFLAQFNVLLDFPARRLYLHRLDKSNPSLDSNRQVDVDGMILGVDNGTWRIVTLDMTSRFYLSGLRQGDILDALDRTKVSDLLGEEIIAKLLAGKATFHLRRMVDGKEETLAVLAPK